MSSTKVTEHRGVDVFVNERGTFYTEADCTFGAHEGATLAELRRKVDAAGAAAKGPENAFMLHEGRWSSDLPKVRFVTCGSLIPSKYVKGREVWVTHKTGKGREKSDARFVFEATPENLDKAKAYIAAKKAEHEAAAAAKAAFDALVSVEESVPSVKQKEV